jgi:hypothetical protein
MSIFGTVGVSVIEVIFIVVLSYILFYAFRVAIEMDKFKKIKIDIFEIMKLSILSEKQLYELNSEEQKEYLKIIDDVITLSNTTWLEKQKFVSSICNATCTYLKNHITQAMDINAEITCQEFIIEIIDFKIRWLVKCVKNITAA